MFSHFAFSGLFTGTFMSMLVHLGTGGGLYFWFVKREPPPMVADLDLTMSTLVPVMPNAGGGYGAKQSEEWFVASKEKKMKTPVPVQQPAVVETKEDVIKEEASVPACPNCPQGNVVGQGWGGGSGEGDGQYIPVEAATRKPRWIANFITTKDYPTIARQNGKDGRVVLTVLIDSEGRVRDVRLLEGSYDVLNEVALRKVKQARFSPAYNDKRKPVSCKVTLPIRFELR